LLFLGKHCDKFIHLHDLIITQESSAETDLNRLSQEP